MRPVLKPALRRLWRDGTTLQLGVDPSRALLLRDLRGPVVGAMELLDGTRRRHDVLADAGELGVDADSAAGLIDLLLTAGALDDASGDAWESDPADRARLLPELAALSVAHPAPGLAQELLRRRKTRHVRIVGAGRVGAAVARLLVAAGVGAVTVDDPGAVRPADVLPGGHASETVGRPRQLVLPGPPDALDRRPDLAVLAPVGPAEVPLEAARAFSRAGVPQLAARVRELRGVVGPLVLPGVTTCLTCVHLHRLDRDPGWPVLAAQLNAFEREDDPASAALCAIVAGLTCLHALAMLDDARPLADDHPCAGGTLELEQTDWRLRRRSWPPHPGCGCLSSTVAPGGPAGVPHAASASSPALRG